MPIAVVSAWAATLFAVADMGNKSNLKSLTFCGICVALITVIMLFAYIPSLTYSVPAIAGIVLIMVMIEFDLKYAIITYTASVFTVFLFCEMEAKLLYIMLFGIYPWLKCIIERINSKTVAFVLKLLYFNIAAVTAMLILRLIMGLSIGNLGLVEIYTSVLFLAVANLVFLLYDFVLYKLADFYILRFHKTVQKILKK